MVVAGFCLAFSVTARISSHAFRRLCDSLDPPDNARICSLEVLKMQREGGGQAGQITGSVSVAAILCLVGVGNCEAAQHSLQSTAF